MLRPGADVFYFPIVTPLPVTEGTQGGFSLPGKMCWTSRCFHTCCRCKIWAPQKNYSLPWCPKLVTVLVSNLDLVWESYKDDSLRRKQGRTEEKGCEGVWRVPQSYQETGRAFYVSTQTTMSYFTFVSAMLVQSFQKETKEVIVTDGEAVICLQD